MLYVLLTVIGMIILRWIIEQVVIWREGSVIIEHAEARNHAFTMELIRRFGAAYLHTMAHRSIPKEGYLPDPHNIHQT